MVIDIDRKFWFVPKVSFLTTLSNSLLGESMYESLKEKTFLFHYIMLWQFYLFIYLFIHLFIHLFIYLFVLSIFQFFVKEKNRIKT